MATVRINREEFLTQLQAISPGLAAKAIIEQSSSFVFKSGKALSFNDEVACRAKTELPKDFEGAVRAKPLLDLLQILEDEELDLEMSDTELLVVGKGSRTGIQMEREILLSLGAVEKPEQWIELRPEFAEGIGLVADCAGRDAVKYKTMCIHLHPNWLEATDNVQAARYKLKTGVSGSILVRATSLKHIISLGMTEFAETASWMHFRNNSNGLIFSVRRYIGDSFPDLDSVFVVEGDSTTLPKDLEKVVKCAHIFSSTNTQHDHILVEIRPGKMRIKGIGTVGWHSKLKNMPVYQGPPRKFLMAPAILIDISKKHNDVVISEKRLKIESGRFVYISCLSKVEEEKPNAKSEREIAPKN